MMFWAYNLLKLHKSTRLSQFIAYIYENPKNLVSQQDLQGFF